MEYKANLPENIRYTLKLYKDAGFEAFVVGGATRDILLGKEPHDFDIASSATPDEGISLFEANGIRTIDTSKKHGTIIAIVDGEQVEITTYRVEGDYADSRHPDEVLFTRSIEEDVARRDFTMNSIYIDSEGKFIDLFGGIKDIEDGIIRTVRDANERFTEDALRMLRALRFAANLGFKIEDKTRDAIFKNKELLRAISKERIASEFVKLLTGRYASGIVREYLDVFAMFIPELSVMRGFDQKSKYHDKDLLEHTLSVLDGVKPRSEELCVAALLHDTGKPKVFKIDEEGLGHMKLHHLESVKIATKFLDEYKFSNAFKKKVLDLVLLHDTFPEKKSSIKKYVSEYSVEFMEELGSLQRADINAHSDYGKRRISILEARDTILREIVEAQECMSMKDLKISGSDVIMAGVPEGPRVGEVMRLVFEKVIEEELPNEKDALLKFVEELV